MCAAHGPNPRLACGCGVLRLGHAANDLAPLGLVPPPGCALTRTLPLFQLPPPFPPSCRTSPARLPCPCRAYPSTHCCASTSGAAGGARGATWGRGAGSDAFQPDQRRLWKLVRWENGIKETLWRLAVDGLALPGNTHLARLPAEPCGCGTFGAEAGQHTTPRRHHFWNCPVARCVRQQIESYTAGPVSHAHLWLAKPPDGCNQPPWAVITLAALSAMEAGRTSLRVATRNPAGARAPQTSSQGSASLQQGGEDGGSPLERACARAAADLWVRLRTFTALGVPRHGWGEVGPSHPVLSVEVGRLSVAQPVVFVAQEAAD